jgi:hypothetical protein
MFLSHSCRLTFVCLAINQFCDAIFSFWIFLIVFGPLFCIIQIIMLAFALAQPLSIGEGASEDDIKSLPMYRFSQPNVMIMVDKNKKQHEAIGLRNLSHISELSLHPDDSVSTNWVFSYLSILNSSVLISLCCNL